MMMKKVYMTSMLILSILFSGVLIINTPEIHGSEEKSLHDLNLMTFNIRNIKGEIFLSPNYWLYRKDKVCDVINDYIPDIIGMQEGFKRQIDYLLNNTNDLYASIGLSRYGNEKDEYSNILYNKEKFNVIDSGQFWLSETPDIPGSIHPTAVLPRICTFSKFSFKENENVIFYYFNTHYSHISSYAREVSSAIISERIDQIVQEDDIPVFIGGDLNCEETSLAFKTFINNDFEDTWTESGNDYVNDGTFHGWQGDINGSHIDWIFGKGYEKVNTSEIIYYNTSNLYPSDHFPVIIEVTIPGK